MSRLRTRYHLRLSISETTNVFDFLCGLFFNQAVPFLHLYVPKLSPFQV